MATYNKGKPISDDVKSYIRSYFAYDPDTGIISRTDRKNSNGSFDKDGYLILKIKTHHYKAHRVAWFLYYGDFPTLEIDHINRNRSDNRISNLRESDREMNNRNSAHKINPATGVVGVYLDNSTKVLKKKFATRIKGRTYRFYSLTEAVNLRIENHLTV